MAIQLLDFVFCGFLVLGVRDVHWGVLFRRLSFLRAEVCFGSISAESSDRLLVMRCFCCVLLSRCVVLWRGIENVREV